MESKIEPKYVRENQVSVDGECREVIERENNLDFI